MTAPLFTGYDRDPQTVARRLLGQRLVRVVDGHRLSGAIIEVEAYLGAEDRAAHTYGGRRTARNESMYLPGGHSYVYFIYGMHHCLNIVCGSEGEGVAVLVRGLLAEEGVPLMYAHRPAARRDADLCSGPGKLAAALRIGRDLDGTDLRTGDVLFIERRRQRALPERLIRRMPRIGVDYAGEWARKPLRFVATRV